MNIRYVHCGSNKFRPELVYPARNHEFLPKPYGCFWGSRLVTDYGWIAWCEDNDFELERLKSNFQFTLAPDANIIEIRNLEDLKQLPLISATDFAISGKYRIDFEKLQSEGYDGVEVLIDDFQLYQALYGWDCDSIVIWNPNCVREEADHI